ncbi:MAG: NAD(P)-dependent glycerol-3-phosphate dehydrogenase, partial [Alphaproteobacteria bacterium]|nr:NAD(P)-dependent glycerol-3-phosphate dehydrogenase [Alphaproteobacteria bacterium]
MTTVSVIGGGSWGTALALTSVWANNKTLLWMRDADALKSIRETRMNEKHLKGVLLPETVEVTADLERAAAADILLLVTPAQTIREMLLFLKPFVRKQSPIVICSKGIEITTGLSMHEVGADILPGHLIALLSGPTFALDVANGFPITATLSASTLPSSQALCQHLSSKTFRLYPTNDLAGVAIAGSLKNVIAIAAGIAHGKGLAESSKASLITRGLAEITRLGKAKGANKDTFLGPAGVGDLILSCTSLQSRNMHLGQLIGQSNTPFSKLTYAALSEGVFTA